MLGGLIMRKASILVLAMFLACPTFAAKESREQKRLETCGQVLKEIMNIPDGIPKDLLNKAEQGADPDFLRDGLKLLAQELMDAEVTQLVGAGLHERAESRLTYRNGYREREWDTRVGTIELIPKLRAGTYFPSLLQPRRRHERALLSVVQEAYIHGVSTRAVDALAEALGLKGISKDQVSRICKELDAQVHAFRTRPLDAEYPYLMLDATFEKVRENGRVISMAVLIATGVKRTGEREVLGVDVGPAEDLEFWRAFLRQLLSRGLRGVRLVTSDSHLAQRDYARRPSLFVKDRQPAHRMCPHHLDGLLDAVPEGKRQRLSAADLSYGCGWAIPLLGDCPDRDVPIGHDAADSALLEHDEAAHVDLPHHARSLRHWRLGTDQEGVACHHVLDVLSHVFLSFPLPND